MSRTTRNYDKYVDWEFAFAAKLERGHVDVPILDLSGTDEVWGHGKRIVKRARRKRDRRKEHPKTADLLAANE